MIIPQNRQKSFIECGCKIIQFIPGPRMEQPSIRLVRSFRKVNNTTICYHHYDCNCLHHESYHYLLRDIYVHGYSFMKPGNFSSALLTFHDVSTHGPSFRILDLACYHRNPSYGICVLNYDILHESSRLSNWLSCGVWCHGSIIYLLYVGPTISNNNWFVSFAEATTVIVFHFVYIHLNIS